MTLNLISNYGLIGMAFVLGIICVLLAICLSRRAARRRDSQLFKQAFTRMRDDERKRRWCF